MADDGNRDGDESETAEKWEYDKNVMVLDHGATESNDGCQLGGVDSLHRRDRIWGWIEAHASDTRRAFDESETTYQRSVDLLRTRHHALFLLLVSREAPPYEKDSE